MVAETEDEPQGKGRGRTTTAQEREELDRERFMEASFFYQATTLIQGGK